MKLTKKLNIYLWHFAHALWFAGLPVRLFFTHWPLLSKISDSPLSMKRCLQATFPSLSTGHLPKHCSLAAYQELFKGRPARLIRHRPPSKVCLPQDTFQGLSATGHLPRFLNRPTPREMYKEQHGDYAYWWVMYGCYRVKLNVNHYWEFKG